MSKKMDITHLHAFDADGAIQETHSKMERALSRRGLLVAGGTAAAAAALPGNAFASGGFGPIDRSILNFALTLEYLESAFYARANEIGSLTGEIRRFAKVVGDHERAHVVALKKTLGSAAVKRPKFDFQGTTEGASFLPTAILLEDTGVEAYQGQAVRIRSDKLLAAALSIHPVEARHAAWARYIAGRNPAPEAFNPAKTKDEVLAAVGSTGFIVG